MSQILIDVMPLVYNLEEGANKKLKIKGLFQKANTKNENGRIYPHYILEREVRRLQPEINERRLLSELNHPDTAEINLERVCMLVTELAMKGDDVIGSGEIMSGTPYGAILESLLRNNVMLGISSRGKGSTTYKNGVDEVCEDYKMITFDIVSRPSTPGAYPKAISESVNGEKRILSFSDIIDKTLSGDISEKEMLDIFKGKGKTYIF